MDPSGSKSGWGQVPELPKECIWWFARPRTPAKFQPEKRRLPSCFVLYRGLVFLILIFFLRTQGKLRSLTLVSCHHHPTLRHLSRNPWCLFLGKIQFSSIFWCPWHPAASRENPVRMNSDSGISSISPGERQFNLQNYSKVTRRALQFWTFLIANVHSFPSAKKRFILASLSRVNLGYLSFTFSRETSTL